MGNKAYLAWLKRKRMKKVYVASPVRPVLEFTKIHNDIEHGVHIVNIFARSGCKAVKAMGMLPVSPILAFDGVYDEFSERETIDKACEALLLACDFIYVVDTPYNEQSKGIARELDIAAKNGINILYVMEKDEE